MSPLAERMRPVTLDDYIGQEHLVGQGAILRKSIETGVLPSLIFWGPPGVGKTTLAGIIAKQLRRPFYVLSAISSGVKDVRDVIDRAQKYAGELKEVPGNPILFIDEIHRFSKSQQDALLPYVEEGVLTLVGATTRSGLLTAPLLSRFAIKSRLEYYPASTLKKIVLRAAAILQVPISEDAAGEIARRSRGTPRIANGLLRRVRDFAQVLNDGNIDIGITQHALKALNVDEHGLDDMDNRILSTIIEKFKGGPVGITTIATAVGEEAGTLEEVYEPFLIQEGFIKRTPRGREATDKAYIHLGKNPFQGNEKPTLFD